MIGWCRTRTSNSLINMTNTSSTFNTSFATLALLSIFVLLGVFSASCSFGQQSSSEPSALIPECQAELEERSFSHERFDRIATALENSYSDERYHYFSEQATLLAWHVAPERALNEESTVGEAALFALDFEGFSSLTYLQCLEDYGVEIPQEVHAENRRIIDRYNTIVSYCESLPDRYQPEPGMFAGTCGDYMPSPDGDTG